MSFAQLCLSTFDYLHSTKSNVGGGGEGEEGSGVSRGTIEKARSTKPKQNH